LHTFCSWPTSGDFCLPGLAAFLGYEPVVPTKEDILTTLFGLANPRPRGAVFHAGIAAAGNRRGLTRWIN